MMHNTKKIFQINKKMVALYKMCMIVSKHAFIQATINRYKRII